MSPILSLNRTNSVSNKDWLNVSKHLIITAHEPHTPLMESPGYVFTKADFERDLKKVTRKIKK